MNRRSPPTAPLWGLPAAGRGRPAGAGVVLPHPWNGRTLRLFLLMGLGGGAARFLRRCRLCRCRGRACAGRTGRILPRRLCTGRHGGAPGARRRCALCFRAAAGDRLLGGPLPGRRLLCVCVVLCTCAGIFRCAVCRTPSRALGVGCGGLGGSCSGVCPALAVPSRSGGPAGTVPRRSGRTRTAPGGRHGRRSGRRVGASPGRWPVGAPGARGFAGTVFSCRVRHGFRHCGTYALDHSIGHHAGQAPAQAVPSDGGVQPHAGHDAVRLPRHPCDAHDEQHPGQHPHIGGAGI